MSIQHGAGRGSKEGLSLCAFFIGAGCSSAQPFFFFHDRLLGGGWGEAFSVLSM